MKRNFCLVILAFFLAIVFVYGCAGTEKTVLQEEQEKAAAKEAAAATEAKSAVAEEGAMKEDEAARKRAEQEQAEREAALKAEAEREAALKTPAEREAASKVKAGAVVVPSQELYEFADIHFDFDKFNLQDEARGTLKNHADWLNKNKDVMVVIEGHCDERGTAEYNLALGERRANSAAKYLTDMGIDAKRIKTISYGFERPLDPGHNEEAWAKNRRAHFVASGKK